MGQFIILLVDDSGADAALVREAIKTCTLPVSLHIVQDGLAALAFLHREGQFADVPRPDLVLLDLDLPKKDGHSLLAELRSDPAFRRLPIVVFSGSGKQSDIDKSYRLGANFYICKPLTLEEFFQAVRTVVEQWDALRTAPHESPTLVRAELKSTGGRNDL